MEKMASGLDLARPPQVGGIDAQSLKRITSSQEHVVHQDRAEFERKGIERPLELVRR